MSAEIKTLNQFIVERQADFKYATGELSRLLSDIGIACKIIHRSVNKAGLVNILGETGDVNVQGESVKKLDIFANEQLISALKSGGECCIMASEEDEGTVSAQNNEAKYVVTFDPLDGSSNIDVNASIGTIFAIYRRVSEAGTEPNEQDVLQKGSEQVAAGYVIYGSSTMMVYTTGNGVNGFTYDPSIGEFCLSHPVIKIPEQGKIYSINEGNWLKLSDDIKRYIEHCKSNSTLKGKPYSARYIGSLVADFHRNLLKGGIFLYPAMEGNPNGKLRLVYEANPMAFIIEQAGGKASDGSNRIMEIQPNELHQRVPLFIGSKSMVEEFEAFLS